MLHAADLYCWLYYISIYYIPYNIYINCPHGGPQNIDIYLEGMMPDSAFCGDQVVANLADESCTATGKRTLKIPLTIVREKCTGRFYIIGSEEFHKMHYNTCGLCVIRALSNAHSLQNKT